MNIKKRIKNHLIFLLKVMISTALGRILFEMFIEAAMAIKFPVKHGKIKMEFTSPNRLTHYRSSSFSTKEPETLAWVESIPPGGVLWDVGANVGLYSIYAAKIANAQVISFEPSVFNLELLARNIYLNNLEDKITIVPIALSDKVGPSLFKMGTLAWGGALSTFDKDFDQNGSKYSSVFEYMTIGIPMDAVVNLLNIPKPSYIKIDVDGIEHFILRGGVEVLNYVDSVLLEINDEFIEQARESEILLKRAGLTLYKKCDLGVLNQYNQWWIRSHSMTL